MIKTPLLPDNLDSSGVFEVSFVVCVLWWG